MYQLTMAIPDRQGVEHTYDIRMERVANAPSPIDYYGYPDLRIGCFTPTRIIGDSDYRDPDDFFRRVLLDQEDAQSLLYHYIDDGKAASARFVSSAGGQRTLVSEWEGENIWDNDYARMYWRHDWESGECEYGPRTESEWQDDRDAIADMIDALEPKDVCDLLRAADLNIHSVAVWRQRRSIPSIDAGSGTEYPLYNRSGMDSVGWACCEYMTVDEIIEAVSEFDAYIHGDVYYRELRIDGEMSKKGLIYDYEPDGMWTALEGDCIPQQMIQTIMEDDIWDDPQAIPAVDYQTIDLDT